MIEGDVKPGATVTVRATPTADVFLRVRPDTGWVGDSDHTYATLEITLESINCDTTVIDGSDVTPASTNTGSVLPDTGIGSSTTLLGALGAVMVLAGAAFLTTRRRTTD